MSASLDVELETEAPFDLGWLLTFFARRAVKGVEEVLPDGGYRRSVRLDHGPAVIELRSSSRSVEERVRCTARIVLVDRRDRAAAASVCRQLLDLGRDPRPVAAALQDDPLIGPLITAVPGLRVPGTSDPHELAVRAVLGQQISLAGAATLAARLVAAHGEALAQPVGAVTHLFPTAGALAAVDPEGLPMPAARSRALVGLAAALAGGDVRLDPAREPDTVRGELLGLPGIGPWTAEYIAMRALRDPDAFMPTDLGVRHALARLGIDPRRESATRVAEAWRPYRAYAQMHLWAARGAADA